MDNLSMMLQYVAAQQQKASFMVLLPSLFSDPNSKTTVDEWTMFSPLADLFATQVAPDTVYTNPVQFLNWIFAHQGLPGAHDYVKHIVDSAKDQIDQDATDTQDAATLRWAEQSLNNHGVLAPHQHFK